MFARVIAGFLQAASGVAVAVCWRQRHPVVVAANEPAEFFVHGLSHFLYFLVATAWGWLALWLFVEGILRVLAAAMEQPFSTLPAVLARAAWSLRPARRLPDDEVSNRLTTSDQPELVIDSAREYDWHALTTVEVDGALYAVTREAGTRERPHRYRLAPIAPDHVVRSVTRYATNARDGAGRTGRPPRR